MSRHLKFHTKIPLLTPNVTKPERLGFVDINGKHASFAVARSRHSSARLSLHVQLFFKNVLGPRTIHVTLRYVSNSEAQSFTSNYGDHLFASLSQFFPFRTR